MITLPLTLINNALVVDGTEPTDYKAKAIDGTPTAEYPHGCVRFYLAGDELPAMAIAPDIPTPNWVQFRRQMMIDPDYIALSDASPAQAGRVEVVITTEGFDVAALVVRWNSFIAAGVAPSPGAIARWQGYADAANVPFVFAADGSITIEEGL